MVTVDSDGDGNFHRELDGDVYVDVNVDADDDGNDDDNIDGDCKALFTVLK